MTYIFGTAALWPAEEIINHLISTDSHVREQIRPFAGKSLEVKAKSPTIVATLFFESDRIRLNAASAETLNVKPSASVSGKATDLISTLVHKEETALANPNIKLTGDAHFIQELRMTIQSLDIQWSDLFAPITGDVITYEVEKLVGDLQTWGADANRRVKRNVNDYLVEEARYVPHSSAVEKFNEDLDALRFKIDRVKAKADSLYRRFEQLND